jgi:hypothetical protein
MSPNRNTFNISNSTYLNPNPQIPFESVILTHNQAKHVSPTVSKAIEAVIVACKTPVHTNTFSNEPISFRSPKLCAEIKSEKERKSKLLSQQQQQPQQPSAPAFNTGPAVANPNVNTKQTNQANIQQATKFSPNPQTQTIQKNVTITQTQQSITTASPSSPSVSNLLSSNQILAKANNTTSVGTTIRSNINSGLNQGASINTVNKSPQQQPGAYHQIQQQNQTQQRNIGDFAANSSPATVSISRANSTVFTGQPPIRFFSSKFVLSLKFT